MNKYIFSIFLTLAIIMMTMSCQKKELIVYNGESNIYFNTAVKSNLTDSQTYSFAKDTLTRDIVTIRIGVMGKIADTNRHFILQLAPGTTTAIAGEDYIMPSDTSFYISADSSEMLLKIILFRPANLRGKSVRLALQLKPNDNFQTNMPVQDHSVSPPVSATQFTITLDDILTMPSWWPDDAKYLGVFSQKKTDLFVQSLNGELSLSDFIQYGQYYPGLISNAATRFQQYLNQQQAAGNTIYEDDGSIMVMGPDAQ